MVCFSCMYVRFSGDMHVFQCDQHPNCTFLLIMESLPIETILSLLVFRFFEGVYLLDFVFYFVE